MVKNDPLFGLRDKVIVIAGAGGGLGCKIARELHERGARLVLFDTDEDRLGAVAAECPEAEALAADIRDETALRSVVSHGVEKFGRIDGAVNAAGVLHIAPSLTMDEAIFRESMEINLTGAFLMSRVVAEAMFDDGRGGGGSILHLASVSSLVANAHYAAYASSKAALSQLVRVLAREWAPRNITVNAIGPAMTQTPMSEKYLADPEFKEKALAVIPMGRLGEPEDLLGTVILLLAAGGAFITGQTIYVDGGRTLV